MRTNHKILYLAFLLLFTLFACQKNEVATFDTPNIELQQEIEVAAKGASTTTNPSTPTSNNESIFDCLGTEEDCIPYAITATQTGCSQITFEFIDNPLCGEDLEDNPIINWTVGNNLNPIIGNTFVLNYNFGVQYTIEFEVFLDGETLSNSLCFTPANLCNEALPPNSNLPTIGTLPPLNLCDDSEAQLTDCILGTTFVYVY